MWHASCENMQVQSGLYVVTEWCNICCFSYLPKTLYWCALFSKGQKLLYCWFKAVPQTVPWLHRLGCWKGCCIWSCFWDQHELKKSSVQVKYSHHYATIAYYSQANRYTCSTAQHKYLNHQSQAVTLPVYLGMPTWLRQSADVQTNQKKSD